MRGAAEHDLDSGPGHRVLLGAMVVAALNFSLPANSAGEHGGTSLH